MECAHHIDSHSTSGIFSLLGRKVRTQLADPRLAIVLSDMTGEKKQIAGTKEGHESCHRSRRLGKGDIESVELVVYGHCHLLGVGSRGHRPHCDLSDSLARHIRYGAQYI